jgi:hypothetical protein
MNLAGKRRGLHCGAENSMACAARIIEPHAEFR